MIKLTSPFFFVAFVWENLFRNSIIIKTSCVCAFYIIIHDTNNICAIAFVCTYEHICVIFGSIFNSSMKTIEWNNSKKNTRLFYYRLNGMLCKMSWTESHIHILMRIETYIFCYYSCMMIITYAWRMNVLSSIAFDLHLKLNVFIIHI